MPPHLLRPSTTRRLSAAAARSLPHAEQQKAFDTALRVLQLVSTEPTAPLRGAPTRLIQSCMGSLGRAFRAKIEAFDDPLALFRELYRRTLPLDSATAAGVLSFCGGNGDLTTGMQLHSLCLKIGIHGSVAVSSSLIRFYSRCGNLVHAHQVFDDMPVESTASYTALITAFARHSRPVSCFLLFNEMRAVSDSDPNDFTIASILGACTDVGCLGLGRSVHGLGMKMGFEAYPHVGNALISMYAKCGSIGEAGCVFERMGWKDLVSWNSMISGFAQYGLAVKALDLLEEMERTEAFVPDAITFLGVLSSCRHAGFVEKGYMCFISMLNHGLQPGLDHYACIVDLLGRAGLLEQALNFIKLMPLRPNAVIWGSLLSACKVHGNVRMGIMAACSRLIMEPECGPTHVQLANMYATIGCWSGVAMVRKLMKERGLKTSPGFSWIEVGDKTYRFKAEGRGDNEVSEEVYVLESLDEHIKGLCLLQESELELQADALY